MMSKNRSKTIEDIKKQIEAMVENHKEKALHINELAQLIIEYINFRISPYSLSNSGETIVKNFADKFPVYQILDGIDEAYTKYIVFENNNIEKSSVETFINKISTFIVVTGMPSIRRKILYIRGIARNRFNYWNEEKGTALLEDYVKALETYGWNDQQILDDLEQEIMLRTKRATNWSEWRDLLEQWTKEINQWKKNIDRNDKDYFSSNLTEFLSEESIDAYSDFSIQTVLDHINILFYLCKAYPQFPENNFKQDLYKLIIDFIDKQKKDHYSNPEKMHDREKYVDAFMHTDKAIKLQDYYFINAQTNDINENDILPIGSLNSISYIYASEIICNTLYQTFYSTDFTKTENCLKRLNRIRDYFNELIENFYTKY